MSRNFLSVKVYKACLHVVCRAMNHFLIVLLVVLVIEAAVLTGLKEWWYSDSKNTVESHWYGLPENEMSVSYFWFSSLFILQE